MEETTLDTCQGCEILTDRLEESGAVVYPLCPHCAITARDEEIDRLESMPRISALVERAHDTAIAKGWYDDPPVDFATHLANIHGEVSEAWEEYRAGADFRRTIRQPGDNKPEGIPTELADIVIRVFDLCGYLDIDLEAAILEKMAYNDTRPHRHGGKRA